MFSFQGISEPFNTDGATELSAIKKQHQQQQQQQLQQQRNQPTTNFMPKIQIPSSNGSDSKSLTNLTQKYTTYNPQVNNHSVSPLTID